MNKAIMVLMGLFLLTMLLGLTDIWQGEEDLALEWTMVWVSFWGIALLYVAMIVLPARKNKAMGVPANTSS